MEYSKQNKRGLVCSLSVKETYFFLFNLSDNAAHSASNKDNGNCFSMLEMIFIFELFKLP